jgi:cytochrome d ubiquinol oxidase subunit I
VAAELRTGAWLGAILIPVQIFVGDLHGLNTLEHQPAKIAAMEGVWRDEKGAPALIFALPNEETRSNDYAIGIPKLASLILTHELDGEIKGLDSFKGEHPPVAPVFWGFRVMVGTGLLMLVVSWWCAWRMRRHAEPTRGQALALTGMMFSGWVATLAGWYVTEIGRQPWLVTGVLRTADAVSDVPAPIVGISLTAYLLIYVFLLGSYVAVLLYLARHRGKPQGAPAPAGLQES